LTTDSFDVRVDANRANPTTTRGIFSACSDICLLFHPSKFYQLVSLRSKNLKTDKAIAGATSENQADGHYHQEDAVMTPHIYSLQPSAVPYGKREGR
jgi:hypothetical protein